MIKKVICLLLFIVVLICCCSSCAQEPTKVLVEPVVELEVTPDITVEVKPEVTETPKMITQVYFITSNGYYNGTYHSVEQTINDWLLVNPDIEVIDIKYEWSDSSTTRETAMIIYKIQEGKQCISLN